jgi:predicted choloylglycine hydrolase
MPHFLVCTLLILIAACVAPARTQQVREICINCQFCLENSKFQVVKQQDTVSQLITQLQNTLDEKSCVYFFIPALILKFTFDRRCACQEQTMELLQQAKSSVDNVSKTLEVKHNFVRELNYISLLIFILPSFK